MTILLSLNQNIEKKTLIVFFLCTHAVCSYRSEDAEAFEVQDGGKSTGIFTKYLNKHVLQPERVTRVLEQVSEGECSYWHSNVTKLKGALRNF